MKRLPLIISSSVLILSSCFSDGSPDPEVVERGLVKLYKCKLENNKTCQDSKYRLVVAGLRPSDCYKFMQSERQNDEKKGRGEFNYVCNY